MDEIRQKCIKTQHDCLAKLLDNAMADVDTYMIIKASKKLNDEIEQELNEADPLDASEQISKNRVSDE